MVQTYYLLLLTVAYAMAVQGYNLVDEPFQLVSKKNNHCVFVERFQTAEIVKLVVYYECLCPDCIVEYPQVLSVIRKLGSSVDLYTLPYGNAIMSQENGTTVVQCQHGPAECYGNKLHACAIDILKDVRKWVEYNACLMSKYSNNAAADECGKSQDIDSGPIKSCANGEKGQELLIKYGKESDVVRAHGVPYDVINGKSKPDEKPLFEAVCEAFTKPPDACKKD